MAVVFLAGITVGTLGLSVWVTPTIAVTGYNAANTTESSTCDGWPQLSFDGYFHCSVTLACRQSGPGNFLLEAVSADPNASNLVVSASLPLNVPCYGSTSFDLAGQLGYSGSVTISLDTF
jgi:hypothetical protein